MKIVISRQTTRRSGASLGFGAAVGATAGIAALYAVSGNARRRALLRDTIEREIHRTERFMDALQHDVANRSRGISSRARSLLRREGSAAVDHAKLEARVRTALGRSCSHPHAVEVHVLDNGEVELLGPVLRSERDRILHGTRRVRGVRSVVDHLELHEPGDALPALQGGARPRRSEPDVLQESWSPSTRMIIGTCGLGVVLLSRRRGPLGRTTGALAGGLMLARSFSNLPLKRLFGVGAGRRAIRFEKTLLVKAPVDRVYEFWTHPERFSEFMNHIGEVRAVGEGRYHWEVLGPGGIRFGWDADVRVQLPNKLIAWRSRPGSIVGNAGRIRFTELGGGGMTQVHILLTYNPPGGALGHVFAKALGADPKKLLDEELLRFQSLMESGRTTGRQGTVELGNMEVVSVPERREANPEQTSGH